MIDGRADNETLGWQPFSQPMGGGSDCDGDLCEEYLSMVGERSMWGEV